MAIQKCMNCQEDKPHKAHGMCDTCYHRELAKNKPNAVAFQHRKTMKDRNKWFQHLGRLKAMVWDSPMLFPSERERILDIINAHLADMVRDDTQKKPELVVGTAKEN